jgi:hypothetical protein
LQCDYAGLHIKDPDGVNVQISPKKGRGGRKRGRPRIAASCN